MDYGMLLLGIVLLIAVVGMGFSATERKLGRRMDRLERKLDAIVAQLGVTIEEPGLAEVTTLLREGKKIEAIKVYRENTGADLKEAHDAVERLS
jgi:ribosomal protein L7/L12